MHDADTGFKMKDAKYRVQGLEPPITDCGQLTKTEGIKWKENKKQINKFKAGAVIADVWANEMKDRQDNKFSVYTIAFERNYKDRDGNWKSTNSMRVNDIPKLRLVAQEAYEYLVRKGSDDNGDILFSFKIYCNS